MILTCLPAMSEMIPTWLLAIAGDTKNGKHYLGFTCDRNYPDMSSLPWQAIQKRSIITWGTHAIEMIPTCLPVIMPRQTTKKVKHYQGHTGDRNDPYIIQAFLPGSAVNSTLINLVSELWSKFMLRILEPRLFALFGLGFEQEIPPAGPLGQVVPNQNRLESYMFCLIFSRQTVRFVDRLSTEHSVPNTTPESNRK